MNRQRFQSDMEAAWELRPGTDVTPGSGAHSNRFSNPAASKPQQVKASQKTSPAAKNRENGS
ncbi:MAG: hypothetical protein FWG31_03370 [Oscillospiraceae bacterium]|nr:hypothetical protein [Oscillospiraceae bacterium]